MAATIKDVARESKVSIATVSHVLNNGPRRVRPETRARVLEVMERLRYHPNTVARGLARKRLQTIGVVMPRSESATLIVNPYFSLVLDGIVHAAAERKQNVTLYTGLTWRNARESLPAFRDRRVDGLLLVATLSDSDIVPALAETDVPFVMVNGISDDPRVAFVDVDNRAAARNAVTHLLELGHRRIGFLCGQANSSSALPRELGYRDALRDYGITPDPRWMLAGYYREEWGFQGMNLLLDLPEPPTAVFLTNDLLAPGAYRACQMRSLTIPQQMSLVGFDDSVIASYLSPPLTTVRQPLAQIGTKATQILLRMLDTLPNVAFPAERLILPTELIARTSTAPPGG